MNCFIQIKDGKPVNHPALESNLLEAFGEIPSNWEPFLRVEKPTAPLYKKLLSQEATYEKVNGVWTDVWTLVDFSPEEKSEFQQLKKNLWSQLPNAFNFTAWIFNEETTEFDPPIPKPQVEGVNYRWCGAENNWKEAPVKPVDGNQYKFDFLAWEWVQVVN